MKICRHCKKYYPHSSDNRCFYCGVQLQNIQKAWKWSPETDYAFFLFSSVVIFAGVALIMFLGEILVGSLTSPLSKFFDEIFIFFLSIIRKISLFIACGSLIFALISLLIFRKVPVKDKNENSLQKLYRDLLDQEKENAHWLAANEAADRKELNSTTIAVLNETSRKRLEENRIIKSHLQGIELVLLQNKLEYQHYRMQQPDFTEQEVAVLEKLTQIENSAKELSFAENSDFQEKAEKLGVYASELQAEIINRKALAFAGRVPMSLDGGINPLLEQKIETNDIAFVLNRESLSKREKRNELKEINL